MKRFSPVGWVFFSVLLSGVVGCDHATKHLAARELPHPVQIVPGVLDLQLARNTDSAFGLLGSFLGADARWMVLTWVTGLITLGALAYVVARYKKMMPLERIAGALVVGGAVGNFSDRILRGHVIDFIHLTHWPIFNVADIAICVGLGLSIFAGRVSRRRQPALGP